MNQLDDQRLKFHEELLDLEVRTDLLASNDLWGFHSTVSLFCR